MTTPSRSWPAKSPSAHQYAGASLPGSSCPAPCQSCRIVLYSCAEHQGLCGLGGACCVPSLSGLCVGKDLSQCLGRRHLLCVLKPGEHCFASLCAVVLLSPPTNPVNQSLIHRASLPSPAQQCLSMAGQGGILGAIPRAGRFRPASNFYSSIGSNKFFARKT